MKKVAAIIAVVLCVLALASTALAAVFLANTKSGKVHYSNCRTIKHPNAAHFVPYDSLDAALADGYVRCGVCMR